MDELNDYTQLNYCLITYDSCRYDTMTAAQAPFLKSRGIPLKATSPATFTLPAHMSFFAGILPLVNESLPLYNRYSQQLFSLNQLGELIIGQVGFGHNHNIVSGFAKLGYQTIGTGAANWFSYDALQEGFGTFFYEPYRYSNPPFFASDQTDFIISQIKKVSGQKYFVFANFCETHTPFMGRYEVNARMDMEWPPNPDSPKARDDGIGKHNPAFKAQIDAINYLDDFLYKLFKYLPGPVLFIVIGDHGECFGEDGFWGHGIYHPKVMEVPMLIFSKGAE